MTLMFTLWYFAVMRATIVRDYHNVNEALGKLFSMPRIHCTSDPNQSNHHLILYYWLSVSFLADIKSQICYSGCLGTTCTVQTVHSIRTFYYGLTTDYHHTYVYDYRVRITSSNILSKSHCPQNGLSNMYHIRTLPSYIAKVYYTI